MRNVKQKFSSCRRAAMLTALAILLSCLPSGRVLAWEIGQQFRTQVVREDATFQMMGCISRADGTDIDVEVQAIILTLNSGYDHSEFLLPATCPDPEDSEITMKIKTYNIQMVAGEGFSPFNTSPFTSLTVPEGVEQFGCFCQFPNVNTVNLSSTVQTGPFPLYYMGALESINVAAGNPYHSSKGDGILYDASGEQLQCLHQNKCNGTSLVIPEGVKSILSAQSIAIYENLEEITLPSTFEIGLPNDFRDGCSNLTTIRVSQDNEKFFEVNGVLFEKYQKLIRNEHFGEEGEEEYILGPVQNKLVFYPKGRTDASYTVPENIEIIGEYAFYQPKFTSVNLSNVTTLEDYALYNCPRNLTLTIPASLVDIAPNAFFLTTITEFIVENGNPIYYVDENSILYENERISSDSEERVKVLKTVPLSFAVASNATFEIPEDVVIIGEAAFKACTNIKGKIKIGKKVTTIRKEAFSSCQLNAVEFEEGSQLTEIQEAGFKSTNLTSINLPGTVTKIGDDAFSYCKFTTLTIPEHITSIGKSAFANNLQLTTVTFENDDFKSIPQHCFDNCTKLETVKFPANCEAIGSYAFTKCKISNEDFIPSTITNIGDHAFENCKFTSLKLPDGLEHIGNSAFFNCSRLTEITIPASVNEIRGNAFGCDKWTSGGITTVNIKNGSRLTNIFDNPFGTKVQTVNFEGSSALTRVGQNAFKDCKDLESFNCPEGVVEIGQQAFMNCNNAAFTRFDFPNAVKYIRQEAFSGCTNLETIAFNKDYSELESIGKNAFYNCAVKDITFPNSLQNIEFEAFRHCENLTEVTLPALIQGVNGGCFNYCPNIENFYVEKLPEDASEEDKANVKYAAVGGYLLKSDKETLVGFPEAKANDRFTLLPPSIRKIGDYAFYCCAKLKNIVIPNKVTSIEGIRAFGQCTNLKTITLLCDEFLDPANINQGRDDDEYKNDKAFDGDALNSDVTLYVRKKLLSQYQDCDFYNVANIVPSFYVVGSEYINVSEDVVDFLSTTSTNHTFVVPETVRNEGGTDMKVELIGDYAFQNAPEDIREVVVFNNVTYVGGNAFVTKLKAETPGLANNESTIKRIYFVTNNPRNDDPAEHATELDKLLSKQLSTDRFELTEAYLVEGKDYGEFTPSQRIYVKKSMCKDYKKRWTDYAGQIDYKIKPGADDTTTSDSYDFVKVSSGKKYSTFSREFDVDLGEYAAEKGEDAGRFDIKAFTMGVLRGGAGREQDYPEGNGETPSSTYTADYHLKMYHIGYEDDLGSDKPEYRKGTYISNSTGVLLAVMNDWNGTPDDYFYCIGEDDNGGARNADAYIDEDGYVNGSLHRAVETTTVLPAIEPDADGVYHPTQWVLQGGVFRYVGNKTINLPPHKAWLYLNTLDMASSESQQGAISAPMMTFGFYLDDNSVATDIEAAEEEGRRTETDGIYTITGVKVVKPETKGIYIINGKKHVIR